MKLSLTASVKCCGLLFVLMAGLGACGCISSRLTTNLKPQAERPKPIKNMRFNVVSVGFDDTTSEAGMMAPFASTNAPGTEENDGFTWTPDQWKTEIMRIGVERYPEIFSLQPAARPIDVSIKAQVNSSIRAMVAMELGTLCVLGGVLPLPVRIIGDFDVTTSLVSDEGLATPLCSIQFQRRDVSWITVFTPLGLLPIPGKSDKRQTIGLWNISQPPTTTYQMTVDSCLEAVVLAINEARDQIIETTAAASRYSTPAN
ncbi:MAG: hypothetical protein R6X19_09375 [Kiritimatiellia bacterium]